MQMDGVLTVQTRRGVVADRPVPALRLSVQPAAGPRTILVARVRPLLGASLARALGELGYRVLGPTSDAAHAVDLALVARPDLALMDEALPGAMAAAGRIGSGGLAPVILLSNGPGDPDVRSAARAGVVGCLVAPVSMRQLRASVALALMGGGRGERSAGASRLVRAAGGRRRHAGPMSPGVTG